MATRFTLIGLKGLIYRSVFFPHLLKIDMSVTVYVIEPEFVMMM